MGSDDEVQIKFRASRALRDAIDRASKESKPVRLNLNQWLTVAAIEKAERQGIVVAEPVPKKKR